MTQDFAPLTQRLNLLHLVRVATAVASVVLAAMAPGDVRVPVGVVTSLTALYLATTTAVEAVRRAWRARAWMVISATILVDGLYVMTVVGWSGGPTSPLLPFAFLELVAVTLLLSYRTGLKAAIWFALAFAAVDALLATGWLVGGPVTTPTAPVAATVVAFLAFTALTATSSSFNERALRRSRQQFRAVSELALSLEVTRGEGAITQLLAEQTHHQLGFRRTVVLVSGRRGASGTQADSDGSTPVTFAGALGDDPTVQAARDGRTVLVRHDLPTSESDDRRGLLDAVLPGATRVAVAPLRSIGGEVIGVIVADCGAATGLPQGVVDAFTQIAAHGALALRNARLLMELERRAARDPLTGLGNRRAFDDNLDRELSRSRRDGSTLSLAIFDIDHFKAVNDTHGHPVGDEVLSSVARLLGSGVRDIDLVSRFGGEEFVILFPDTRPDEAFTSAGRLRRSIEQRSGPIPVTISVGIASFPDHARSGAELLSRADAALYEAKGAGRNRVVVSTRAEPPSGAVRLEPRRTA